MNHSNTVILILVIFQLLALARSQFQVRKADPRVTLKVNSDPKSTWVADNYPGLEFPAPGDLFEESEPIKSGAEIVSQRNFPRIALPTEYDWEALHPQCKFPVRYQGSCGSCWAFGATMCLQTRYCDYGYLNNTQHLSPQEIVSCDTGNLGCGGGYANKLFTYSSKTGLLLDECYTYVNANNGTTQSCKLPTSTAKCPSNSNLSQKRYFSKNAGTYFSTIPAAMEDLFLNGPITAGYTVYNDFYNYKSGIYIPAAGQSSLGGHRVTVTGWGVTQVNGVDVPFWIVKNSWGSTWGEKGYFRIRRGSNDASFESSFWSTLPNATYIGEPPKKGAAFRISPYSSIISMILASIFSIFVANLF